MNEHSYELGRVTFSKQGHDKKRAFVIVGLVDERYVLIADGDTRKFEHPKKKQCKHLHTTPIVATEIAHTLTQGKPLQDSDLRKAISTAVEAMQMGKSDKEECALVQE